MREKYSQACTTCGAPAGKSCRSVRSGKVIYDQHVARRQKTTARISIAEAAMFGYERIRKPIWVHPMDHLKIDIVGGAPGPWLHLYSPHNINVSGEDPVNLLVGSSLVPVDSLRSAEFVKYDGPTSDDPAYQEEVKKFTDWLKENEKRNFRKNSI